MGIYLPRYGIAIFSVIILVIIAFLFTNSIQLFKTPDNTNSIFSSFTRSDNNSCKNSIKYRRQRDDLSRQLNLMKQLYGQQNCEKLKLLQSTDKQVDSRVSESGGWCAQMSGPNSSAHLWDEDMLNLTLAVLFSFYKTSLISKQFRTFFATTFSTSLSNFLKGKTVASFGDGPGQYKKHIDSIGEVSSYIAYDGAPFCETVTGGRVKFLDLTAPQYGLPAYDWVVSVEVGEHIPAKYEDIYLDNLVRHAKEGIVLSWGVPGQNGLSHVNLKAPEAVLAQMEKRGFRIDQASGGELRQASTFHWLKKNVNVYRRQNRGSFSVDDA